MRSTDSGDHHQEAEMDSHPQEDHDASDTGTPPAAATKAAAAARALSNAHNPLLLASMLDLREVCRLSFLCRETRGSFGRRARKICLTHGAGVPEELRIEFWTYVLNVKKEREDHEARARRERPGTDDGSGGDVYEACLYGDDAACDGGGTAVENMGTQATVEQGEGDRPEQGDACSSDGEADIGAGGASKDQHAMPLPSPRASVLPPSGWRVLSRIGAEGEISRDVGRTFPRQELFKSRNGPGQNLLANVLKACLKTNPDVGYCQGMNFVAGSLLLACATRDPAVHETFHRRPGRSSVDRARSGSDCDADGGAAAAAAAAAEELSPFVATTATAAAAAMSCTSSSWEGDGSGDDENQPEWRSGPAHLRAEKDVFWLMLALTSRISGVGSGLGMRELWLPGVPQLKVRVFQFDKLMLRELPRLYNHFKAKQLQLEVLVSQWFLTLFSYSLRPPMLFRVLDLTFTDGWKAMFRFGLARLRSVQDKLCGLELEGVSSFLRNFRDGGDYSPPPSPPPPTQDSNVSWYNRGGKGWGGGGVSPAAGGGKGAGRGDRAVTRKSSSIRLLRACADVKLTRSTLNGLQQDFAVQLLKEHLQGEGQWLTRYGDAPDPTPGAGAGVIGGDRDGDVGFMGVEAMTRMMLSDSKLLKRLKEKLTQMAAPLQADARVFQNKITEASERLEHATRERSSLSGELLCLKEDIEALGQRKKLVTEQMHLLLVQFERDTAVPDSEGGQEEDAGSGSGGDGGGGSGGGDNVVDGAVRVSPAASASSRDEDGSFIGGFHDLGSVSGLVGDASGGGSGGVGSFFGDANSNTAVHNSGSNRVASNSGSSDTRDGGGDDATGVDDLSSGVERLGVEPREELEGGGAAGGGARSAASDRDERRGDIGGEAKEVNVGSVDERCCSSVSSFRSRSTSDVGDASEGGGHCGDERPATEDQQQQQQQGGMTEEVALDASAAGTAAAEAEGETGMLAGSDADRSPAPSFPAASKDNDHPGESSSESPMAATPPRGSRADNTPQVIWNTTSDHTFLQQLPPPPSWEDPKNVSLSTLGEAGTATAELSPPPLSRNSGGGGGNADSSRQNDAARLGAEPPQQRQGQQQQQRNHSSRAKKPTLSPRLAGALPGSGLTPFSPQSSPKGGFFMGRDVDRQEGGHVGGGGVSRGMMSNDNGTRKAAAASAGGGGWGSPGEGKKVKTAWNRLAKWVGSSSSSSSNHEGGGSSGGGAKPSSPLYSNWFASATASSTNSSRSVSAFSRRGGGGSRERGGGTTVSSSGMSSLSPPRIRRRGRRGQLSLMEELYRDLEQLKKRLEEVQSGIDDKSEMYATLHHSYTRALTEAEEASELKSALSSQMIQLLFEQEQRLEGYLRECITFDGNSAGPLAAGAGGEDTDENYAATVSPPQGSDSGGGGGGSSGRRPTVERDAVGSDDGAPRGTVTTSHVSGGGLRSGGGTAGTTTTASSSSLSSSIVRGDVGNFTRVSTRGSSPMGGEGDDPGGTELDDGFERVDAWMAEDFPGGAVGAAAAAAEADALRRQRERAGSLLVPFPSGYS